MKKLLLLLSIGLTIHANANPEKRIISGINYLIFKASPRNVRIIWKDDLGKQLRTFSNALHFLNQNGDRVKMLMNGGIYEPQKIPTGLLVQNGKILRLINRQDGKGNFYLKPNGIFLIHKEGALIISTEEYPLKGKDIISAVQSGPLLLHGGKIHPVFNPNSHSRLHRNGVGITKTGDVIFAISDSDSPKFPNLHEFASAFQSLGCENALFLDGNISQMKSDKAITETKGAFASLIAVMEERETP